MIGRSWPYVHRMLLPLEVTAQLVNSAAIAVVLGRGGRCGKVRLSWLRLEE